MPGRSDRVLTRPFLFLWLATFFQFAAFFLLIPVLPLYVESLGGDAADIGAVVAAFTLSSMTLRPLIGHWVDRIGRRPFLLAGTLVFVVMTPVYGWTATVATLIVVRILHGFGMALYTTASITTATDLAPPHRRGEAMAWFAMANTVAIGSGPTLGALALRAGGYWGAFLTAAACSILALTMAASVAVPPVAPSPEPRRGVRLIHPAAVAPALLILTLSMTYGAMTAFIPLLVRERGLGNEGWFFAAYAGAIIALRPFAGVLSDRHGRRAVLIPGLACAGLAVSSIGMASSVPMLLGIAAVYGFGVAAAQSTIIALTMDRVGLHGRGLGAATFASALELGLALGAGSAGLLVNATNYTVMFALIGLAPICGSVATWFVKEAMPMPLTDTPAPRLRHPAPLEGEEPETETAVH